MRWSDSDAAKVTKRVENYLSKNRGDTSQREYVEKVRRPRLAPPLLRGFVPVRQTDYLPLFWLSSS